MDAADIQEGLEHTVRELAERKNQRERDILMIEQKYQADIALVHSRRADLKERLNADRPVCRLPAELLSEVFAIYAEVHRRESGDDDNILPKWPPGRSRPYQRLRPNPHSWARVIHVCRHWRKIALRTASLWTTLVPRYLDSVRHMITYSVSAPLTIFDWTYNPSSSIDLYRLMYAQLPRTRRVVLGMGGMTDTVLKEFDHVGLQAPLLEELEVIFRSSTTSIPTFATAVLPRLTKLKLHDIPSSSRTLLPPLLRSTLTRLSLSGMQGVEVDFFVDLLASTPLLEHLTVIEFGKEPETNPVSAVQHPEIHLSHLQTLTIRDRSRRGYAAAQILSRVSIPPTASFEIQCGTYNNRPLPSAISAITCKLEPAQVLHRAQRVAIYADETKMFKFGWKPPVMASANNIASVSTLSFTTPSMINAVSTETVVSAFFGAADLSRVLTLHVELYSEPVIWPDLVRRMTSLQNLEVRVSSYPEKLASTSLRPAIKRAVEALTARCTEQGSRLRLLTILDSKSLSEKEVAFI